MKFEMTVSVFGLSGLRNAYRSVLSTDGSSEIAGASRWLAAVPSPGPAPLRARTARRATVPSARAASATPVLRTDPASGIGAPPVPRLVTPLIRLSRQGGSVSEVLEGFSRVRRGAMRVPRPVLPRAGHVSVSETGLRHEAGAGAAGEGVRQGFRRGDDDLAA